MSTKQSRWRLAAATMAVAAAMGSTPGAETQAVESIERYCQSSWRNAGISQQEWQDCTQQAVTELIERISTERLPAAIGDTESDERRELNRSVWRIIQRWRRSPRHKAYHDESSIAVNESTNRVGEWDEVDAAARSCLSERQLQILEMIRDGWGVPEIASELTMTTARVSDEKYKAVQKLRNRLAGTMSSVS